MIYNVCAGDGIFRAVQCYILSDLERGYCSSASCQESSLLTEGSLKNFKLGLCIHPYITQEEEETERLYPVILSLAVLTKIPLIILHF